MLQESQRAGRLLIVLAGGACYSCRGGVLRSFFERGLLQEYGAGEATVVYQWLERVWVDQYGHKRERRIKALSPEKKMEKNIY